MTAQEARSLFATARVARLASADAEGRPHLVPIAFAVVGEEIVSAVDAKPKRTRALKRLANVAADPRVAVLADHYEDDWDQLWWVRADGVARVLGGGSPESERAIAALRGRYEQYRAAIPAGPVLAIAVERWSGWRARG